MKYETYSVKIEGVTPLLIHRFTERAEQANADGGARLIKLQDLPPREQAEEVVYRNKDGTFFFPSSCIAAMLCEVGSNHKMKGSRKSFRFIIPAAVFMPEDVITICNGNGKPANDFEVDSRPVVIKATGGRVMRHRPRFDKWSASFNVRVNVDLVDAKFINKLICQGGEINGLGDYRPQKRGPYGRFIVTGWGKLTPDK